MSQENMKRLTLSQAVERKNQSDNDKIKLFDLDSELLGGALPCRMIPLEKVVGYMDDVKGDEGVKENLEFMKTLVFQSSKLLQSPELQEGSATPLEVVTKVYHDNAGEIMRHGKLILAKYGLGNLTDIVKN